MAVLWVWLYVLVRVLPWCSPTRKLGSVGRSLHMYLGKCRTIVILGVPSLFLGFLKRRRWTELLLTAPLIQSGYSEKGREGNGCSFTFVGLFWLIEVENKLADSARFGEKGKRIWTLTLLHVGFFIVDKSLNLTKTRFPHLWNGDNNRSFFTGLLSERSEIIDTNFQ